MAISCRITAVTTVLMLACGIAPHSSGAQEAPATVSDSAEGLKSQIDAILDSAKNHSKKNYDSKRFDDLISDLEISEKSNWFVSTFGDDAGAKLAAKYKDSWGSFQDSLAQSFQEAADWKPKQTLVDVLGSSSPFGQSNISSIQHEAKSPLTLYQVVVVTQKRGKDALPGIYAYAEGGFRVLNWATLYQLPNVKPVRIRVGANVQLAKLVHQVNPVFPPGARENHVQGVVVLHVVIDADGNVKQADIVRGPPEFAAAAQDAVKQWRYEATTLNGDPVEVDTTVSIVFTLGG